MNIVHLLNHFVYCDGCAKHVFLLARRQSELGHSVMVIAGKEDAFQLLVQEGIQCVVNPNICHKNRNYIRFIRGGLQLRKSFRQIRPDIIHAHSYYAANQVKLFTGKWYQRLVQTIHGNSRTQAKLNQFVGQRIITPSQITAQYIISKNPALKKRIDVIHNGVQFIPAKNEPEQERKIQALHKKDGNKIFIGYFGRIVRVKGIFVLAEAFKLLLSFCEVELIIAGDGDDQNELMSLLKAVNDKVHWMGSLKNVQPVMELCDVIILPSFAEVSPMVIIEAGLLAKCVVATNVDGIPEIIKNDDYGILIPPNDIQALVKALLKTVNNKQVRNAKGIILKQHIEKYFNIAIMIDEVMKIYESIKND